MRERVIKKDIRVNHKPHNGTLSSKWPYYLLGQNNYVMSTLGWLWYSIFHLKDDVSNV